MRELPPPAAAEALERFCAWWAVQEPRSLQQHYVETFDLHKRCGLYLTFYGEGDKRARGAALLRLKRLYRAAGLPLESSELPDYLPVMLEFAAARPTDRAKSCCASTVPRLSSCAAASTSVGRPTPV